MGATWSRGSEWRRWDPHLHTPATALNNHFNGDWPAYLDAIENAVPVAEALGVTDYCTIKGYKEFLIHRAAGRAQNVKLAFPNVEFRLDIQTERRRGINLHLLFSPDDPTHVNEIERVLGRLTFDCKGRPYHCVAEDLIKLGKTVEPTQTDDDAAMRIGVEQFKLEFKQLKKLFDEDRWVRQNCLVAVAASEGDGTSGLQKDGAFKTLRAELEAFAHVIFSSHESDRAFWLGQKQGADRDFLESNYRGLKPCLHGSDAHYLKDVLKPDKERYCWIRADATFVGLRQTLLEPEARVRIGSQRPAGPSPSECIAAIKISGASWLETPTIGVNGGLVAIIGPKGSGKTALADFIAQAAGASIHDNASFLLKAHNHLGEAQAALEWADGTEAKSRFLDGRRSSEDEVPLVRYLSQQFVERLCSSEGMAGELLDEIEAVVFQTIPDDERLGAANFADLREIKLGELHETRSVLLARIQELTDRISGEEEKKTKLPLLLLKQRDLTERVGKTTKDLEALIPKEKKKEAEELARVQSLCEAKDKELQVLRLQQTRLAQMEEALARLASEWRRGFEALKEKYSDCGIENADWESFRPSTPVGSSAILEKAKTESQRSVDLLMAGDPRRPKDPENLATWPMNDLRARLAKLTAEMGVEKDRAKKHADLQKQLTGLKADLERTTKEVDDAKQCDLRRRKAVEERRGAYAEVFDLFAREEAVLEGLYAPLRARLAEGEAATRRLDFHVQRNIDLNAWVERGEELLDLRKQGPFQGHGKLAEVAKAKLVPAWKGGDSAVVGAAMEAFLGESMKGLAESRASHAGIQDIGRWLFSTDHVGLTYGIRYDGMEISTLSPGMRGIVLLMLYLAVDQWDLRPLIVDQPEENLDPQSVYDELVGYFRAAKRRRQIILVTHNPNLVVNADADQVIVAHSKREGIGLPQIRYSSGGLEDSTTRKDVCRILEGGARAFREREQRYAFPEDPRSTQP